MIRIRILDPDPAIFVIDLPRCHQKTNFLHNFSAYFFVKIHLHHISMIKSQKESQNSRNQGFSYYFCMVEGSGSIPLTSGSGSGRPKTCGSGSATLFFLNPRCGFFFHPGSRRLKSTGSRIRIRNTYRNPVPFPL